MPVPGGTGAAPLAAGAVEVTSRDRPAHPDEPAAPGSASPGSARVEPGDEVRQIGETA
jgi:hypothetical protein